MGKWACSFQPRFVSADEVGKRMSGRYVRRSCAIAQSRNVEYTPTTHINRRVIDILLLLLLVVAWLRCVGALRYPSSATTW